MKRLAILLPIVLLLVLALPSVVSAAPPVATWENYTAGDDATAIVCSANWTAQSFNITPESHSVYSVRLRMFRVGTPGTAVVGITETDGTGLPTGSDLATGTVNGDVITTDPAGAWYIVLMSAEYSLSYNTTYAIVISAENGDSSNYLGVRFDDTAASYADGSKISTTDGGLTWTANAGDDLMFAVMGRALVSIEDVQVFTDYYATGDLLFAISYTCDYVPFYPLDDVASSFLIQLRGTDGVSVIAQTTCNAWGWKPAEIYLNADSAAPLDYGYPYIIAIEGLMTEDPVDAYTISSGDWKGSNKELLDTWVINLATALEEEYGITLVEANGADKILNDDGSAIFLTGMPSLGAVRQNLFSTGVYDPDTYIEGTGAFDTATTWDNEVGATITDAVTDTATMFGIDNPQNVAGMILMFIYVGLAFVIVAAGGDATMAALLAIPVIVGGTQLRILSFAFIATIASVAILLMMYRLWWSRT